MERNFKSFNRVAILGAGVMGAQIAAHLANADISVLLYDLPSKKSDLSSTARDAISGLAKLSPAPFSSKQKSSHITPANYETDLEKLKDCDLIIEAISERMDWKSDLYKKISPFLSKHTIIASNTSGLGIETLAANIPKQLQTQFLGVHFFNPPRYMSLVEIIPQPQTNPDAMNQLEIFLTQRLGKGVIRAKDTPNFIANRVGVTSMLINIHHAQRLNLNVTTVDALTGTPLGRPKSGTFRLADIVGLDTFNHVIATMTEYLKNDPWHHFYQVPTWAKNLIDAGVLGQKTGFGLYKKEGKEILALNLQTGSYEKQESQIDPEVAKMLSGKNFETKMKELHSSKLPQANYIWSVFRDTFHYCAHHLESIAHTARDVDFALRWGFGWSIGPFETWQSAGWKNVAELIAQDISAGLTISKTKLPEWVNHVDTGVHNSKGSYSAKSKTFDPKSQLDVYKRQIYPDKLCFDKFNYGETLFENSGVRLWHTGDNIGILSFQSKMHVVGDDVLEGVQQSLKLAEDKNLKGVVLWQTEPPFSLGANLAQVVEKVKSQDFDFLEKMVKRFQDTSMAIKYSRVPVVVGLQGMALGGGCEFVMHGAHVVAALESYTGLVEVGVGLLPAGGGCKEFAIRAWQNSYGSDFFNVIKYNFQNIAMGTVSTSAHNAQEMGLLKFSDTVIFNPFEILYVAKKKVTQLFEAGYNAPHQQMAIPVCGRGATATLKAGLYNMLIGKYISEHDFLIGGYIADILCGGDVDGGTLVSEQWLLDLERKHFVSLLKTKKTQERIEFMLNNGKPLRN